MEKADGASAKVEEKAEEKPAEEKPAAPRALFAATTMTAYRPVKITVRIASTSLQCFKYKITAATIYNNISDLTFGFEHFEHFIAKQLFKLTCIRRCADHEGIIVVEASIGGENM